ncbi:MAG: hypothetical protein CME70_05335 [Halobacteriovorax sp.]|nr:hypothetical protein [Halobacteriovorax sp.]|tara:strand:+ start:66966 stop:67760 length:795 start_codon:yes stop_codon:yes gene_type:complete
MLYLNLFINVLIKNPIKAVLFIVTGFSLSLLLGQSEKIQNSLMGSLPKMNETPHFFALIDNKVSSQSIRRKLMGLPGVMGVRNLPGDKIQKQLQTILGDVGEDLASEVGIPDVSGLKISFAPNLEVRSQRLIKQYLTRLTGEDKLTMGPTIGEEKKNKKWLTSFKDSLKLKIGTIVIAIASILYLFLGFGLGTDLGREAYLVERFSRRKNVIQVTAGIGFLGASVLMLMPSILLGNANLAGIGIFFGLTFIAYIITTTRGWRTT